MVSRRGHVLLTGSSLLLDPVITNFSFPLPQSVCSYDNVYHRKQLLQGLYVAKGTLIFVYVSQTSIVSEVLYREMLSQIVTQSHGGK
jgi:hypothetical protein